MYKYLLNVWIIVIFSPGCYVIKEGYHYLKFTSGNKVDLEEAIVNQHISQNQRKKLLLIKSALSFVATKGLNVSNSYDTYVNLGNKKDLTYLIIASEKLELKLKQWCFLLVGCFPYLGFFYQNDRDNMLRGLEKDYDVFSSKSLAFSTVGWTKDYLYSTMLSSKDFLLIYVIFHEIIHKNFWITNNVPLNETIAEVFGFLLAKQFFDSLSLKHECKLLDEYFTNRKQFGVWLNNLILDLSRLYDEFKHDKKYLSFEQKLSYKQKIFDQHIKIAERLSLGAKNIVLSNQWNNAAVLSFKIYDVNDKIFNKFAVCFSIRKNNIKVILKKLKQEFLKQKQDYLMFLEQLDLHSICG